MWPGLLDHGREGHQGQDDHEPEIDVIEQYSAIPYCHTSTLPPLGAEQQAHGEEEAFVVPSMTDDFHTYGAHGGREAHHLVLRRRGALADEDAGGGEGAAST
jgi:hypothetical protein